MPAPYRINPDAEPIPTDPHSWLPLIGHPPGETGPGGFRVLSGVLRPEYRGYRPSLAHFVAAKLAVAAPSDAPRWTVTAYRAEVLLPTHASDHLLDPRILVEAAEREQVPGDKALAAYVTLTSSPRTLHGQYEVARALGQRVVTGFDVAVLLVQHVPSRSGNTAQPHVHMVIPGPRAIMPYGLFGRQIGDLARDKGRALILDLLATIVGETG